jgi:hypothetical protein
MSTDSRSLQTLLRSARKVGSEYCWPATEAESVIRSLASTGQLILDVELWEFDSPTAQPRVLGWSEYEGDSGMSVEDSVAIAADQAIEAIWGHTGDLNLWVSITFGSPRQ